MQYYLTNYKKLKIRFKTIKTIRGYQLVIEIVKEQLQMTDAGECVALKLTTAEFRDPRVCIASIAAKHDNGYRPELLVNSLHIDPELRTEPSGALSTRLRTLQITNPLDLFENQWDGDFSKRLSCNF